MILLLLLSACGGQPSWPEERPAEACAAGAIEAGERTLRFRSAGRVRQALVWVPPGPGPHDVVVLMHSYRGEPGWQARYTGWIEHAAEANALLVAPDGVTATWNAGACCGKARERQVDDVAFLDDLVARLDETACTSGRVLATGLGNGAMMAHRWACESETPDALVAVGGGLQRLRCRQERAIPMLQYDVPGDVRSEDGRPTADGLEAWRVRNQAGEVTRIEDGGLSCLVHEGDAPLAWCTITGAGPGWPGAGDLPPGGEHPLWEATGGGWGWASEAWRVAAGD